VPKVLLKEVVERIKDKVDKDNTHLKYYIGGEHFDYGEVCVTKRALIEGSTIGPAFHMRFMPGDVLLMSRNPHLRKSGVVDFEGLCSDVSYVCRTKNEGILMQSYLPFIFQTDHFWDFAEQNKHGSTNYFLNWTDFEKYEFELPTIEIQKELVKVLWEAQKLKMGYQKMLLATDELVKSQFIGMFGNEDFPTCKLIDECVVITKGTTPTTIGFNFTDAGVNFVKIENITAEGKFIADGMMYISEKCNEAMKRSQLKIGDILFSIAGAIGRSAIVTDEILPANINQALAIVRLKEDTKFIKGFLLAALKSEYVEKQYLALKRGAAQLNLSLKDVGNFTIPIPPVEMQESFVTLYEQSDKSKYHEMKGGELCA